GLNESETRRRIRECAETSRRSQKTERTNRNRKQPGTKYLDHQSARKVHVSRTSMAVEGRHRRTDTRTSKKTSAASRHVLLHVRRPNMCCHRRHLYRHYGETRPQLFSTPRP